MQYLPTANPVIPRPGLGPSLSQSSHLTQTSQGSAYSDVSKDSLPSPVGTVSPVLAPASPLARADSSSLGSDPRSNFVSGISATSSQYRGLPSHSPPTSQAGLAPPVARADSAEGSGLLSPVSPPTPHSKEGKDSLSSKQPPKSPVGSRKSNFGEMLD
jgi:hypothetical protein